MTKEDFDAEVYEYAKSRNGTEDSRMTDRMLAYRAGAEPREKRIEALEAQIEKMKWHDLRKDPNDLPKGHKVVLNQVGMATQYDPNRGFLGFGGVGIIAWCELPLFKEIKEK